MVRTKLVHRYNEVICRCCECGKAWANIRPAKWLYDTDTFDMWTGPCHSHLDVDYLVRRPGMDVEV